MIRRQSCALIAAALLAMAACSQQDPPASSPSAPVPNAADTCGFPKVIALPGELNTTGWLEELDDRGLVFNREALPWCITGQSVRIDGPPDVIEAISRSLPDCSFCGFRVSRVRSESLRLTVMDARTEQTLVEQRVEASDEEEVFSAIVFHLRPPTEERRVQAIALYAITGKAMTLVSASWNPSAELPVDLFEFVHGFPQIRAAREMKPREAARVLYCWSQNGGVTGDLATLLFEEGTDEGQAWNGKGFAENFDALRTLELKQWPKPVWMLMVSR